MNLINGKNIRMVIFEKLTQRERDIIACIISGKSSKVIACILNISPRTVETHLYNLMRKLEIVSRQELIEYVEKSTHYNEFKKHYCNLIELSDVAVENSKELFQGTIPNRLNSFISNKKKYIGVVFLLVFFLTTVSFFIFKNVPHERHIRTNSSQMWNIPNMIEHFVPRKEVSDVLWRNLTSPVKKQPVRIIGLYGLGGVGKSTLAAHMINYPKNEYEFRGWFNAQTPELLTQAYFELGEKEKLFHENLSKEIKIKIVKEWLENKKSSLFVYDNVQEMESLQPYLPNKGHIIITSRNNKIFGATEIEIMTKTEAFNLLDILVPSFAKERKNYKKNVLILIQKLGELPLALTQAGSYMKENMLTVEEYLKIYDAKRIKLLQEKTLPAGDRHDAVYNTWEMSMEALQKFEYGEQAIDLLNFMSVCCAEAIPKKFLIQYLYGEMTPDTEILFNRLVTILLKHSLVRVSGDHLSIHRLFHSWIYLKQSPEQRKYILKKGVKALEKIYPFNIFKTKDEFDFIHKLFPHINTLLKDAELFLKKDEIIALLSCSGDAYKTLGYFEKSGEIIQKTLRIIVEYYGINHVRYADELSRYAHNCNYSGNYEKGKQFAEQALLIQEKKYGPGNIKTITSIRALANASLFLGNYEKASLLINKELKIAQLHHGKSHIATAIIKNIVGFYYLYSEKYVQARTELESALQIFKNLNAPYHREVRITLLNLGWVNLYIGHYDESIRFSEKALEMHLKRFSNDHFLITFITHSMGLAYLFLGNIEKSEEILKDNLLLRQKTYGKHHIRVAYTLNSMGVLNFYKHDYEKAREYFEEAFSIIIKKFGATHKLALRAQINLGAIYRKSNKLREAQEILEKLLPDFRALSEAEDINVGVILANLGLLYGDFGDTKKKKEYLKSALRIFEKHLTPEHIYIKQTKRELETFFLSFLRISKKDSGFFIVY